ncbi:MAG: chemotaxis response regulator protein-glutamate methylesterase [Thermoplasmata archaeon]|nr:chemotaxis response regulator protein-glutamate methylesterase [Thermoplasmata archaeon]
MRKVSQPIRVLVADDSAIMRKLLKDLLESDPDIKVVATAKNGAEAVEIASSQNIDVITMDIEMPKMDGLTALQHIMGKKPTPTIMISAMDKRNADIVMKSLDHGAVDFISKTSGSLSFDIEKIGHDIINKVRVASEVNVKKISRPRIVRPLIYTRKKVYGKSKIIAIGASTGGPKALLEVLSLLPRDIPAGIIITQHMPEGFTKSFAERLNWQSSVEVKEAEHGDRIIPGLALVAPGDYHMEVVNGRIALNKKPKVNSIRPSVDVMMTSAANIHGKNVIGVLLTGMGADGAKGMKDIKGNGGQTIAQNKESCVVFGMPKEAIALGGVDKVVPLSEIASVILKFLEGRSD